MRYGVLLFLVLSVQLVLAAPKPVVLASGEFPPYTSARLPDGGFLNDIIVRSFQLGGLDTDIIFLPWTRAYAGVQKRHFDVTAPYIYSDERDAVFLYSSPLYELLVTVFIHQDMQGQFNRPNDFIGHVWCLPRAYSSDLLQGYLDRGLMSLVRSASDSACLEMVARKRVTAYAMDLMIGEELLAKQSDVLSELTHLPWAIKKSTYHLLIAKDHPRGQEILRAFNQGLAQLKASPEWQSIHDRHGIQIKTLDVEQTPLDDLKILDKQT